ncbi:MAG: hypothetical protein PPHEINF_1080 [uncultured Paraburkholderia sp.]|nr:MAG: hypothetical protein PPHEINF_1080 [uncultured Paraburkholderia sp.]CAH2779943.1 MAG: hypothetical protein PPHEESC_1098 [uncultured Paraburkholderia sp.]CAH2912299.1 MAG: hypothetical protein PPHERAN_0777 [uncultured Paraburkholderia sp.]CAH2915035.1 MAG: hypothetical protein PPHEMADMSA_1246 [uncultured Paraburkholderia sp.]
MGGGSVAGAVGGTVAGDIAGNQVGNALRDTPSGTLLSNVAAGLAGATAGGALGGSAGAMSGANGALAADMYNRQLHPQEKPLTQQLAAAANARGLTNADGSPVTATDVANQLAQMGYSANGVTESGAAATVEGAKPNDGSTWVNAGVDQNTGKTIWAQTPGPANPTLQTFILQNTNGADVPLLQQYTALPVGAHSQYGSQGISMGSSAGSICPNGNCGTAYQSVSMPSPATLTDKGATALALTSPWLPPPFDVAALVGSAGLQSLNYLYSPPSRASVLYSAMSSIGGALLPQGPRVQTLFTLGTTAAQPYIAP